MKRILVNLHAPKHAATQPLQYQTYIYLLISRRFAVWLAGDLLYTSEALETRDAAGDIVRLCRYVHVQFSWCHSVC